MKTYRALLARAELHTHLGATITSDRVYYSLRNPPREATYDRSAHVYFGKLERGSCVDATDPERATPEGLSAEQIRYVCTGRPPPSHVFQRSAVHKGNEGLLNGAVECRVTRPFGNLPPDRRDEVSR